MKIGFVPQGSGPLFIYITLSLLVTACGGGGGTPNSTVPGTTSGAIQSVFPLNDSKGVALNQYLQVELGPETVRNAKQITAQFLLAGPDGVIPGTVTIVGNSIAKFTPSIKFRHFTTYSANISINIQNMDGSFVTDNRSWTFKTAWTQVTTSDVGGCCRAGDQAFDSAGNIYVTGYTEGNFDGNLNVNTNDRYTNDGFLIKYAPNGTKLWSRQFGSASDDYAHSIAVAQTGDIFITGHVGNSGGDIFLSKFDNNGSELWTTYLGVTGHFSRSVTMDRSGDIVVVAQDYLGQQVLLSKFSLTGQRIWQTYYKNEFTFTNSSSIAVDSNNNIYVIADVQKYLGSTWHNFLVMVKYDTNGVMLSESLIEPRQSPIEQGGNSAISGLDIAIDSNNNLYCVGSTKGILAYQPNRGYQDSDGFLLKFLPNGTQEWVLQFGTTGEDSGSSVFLDSNNDIYVYGSAGGKINPQFPDTGAGLFAKYDATGSLLFMRPDNLGSFSAPNHLDSISSNHTDGHGHIYRLGNGLGTIDGNLDTAYFSTVLLRFDMDGNRE